MTPLTLIREPLQVGPMQLQHRALMPPHGQLFNDDFLPSVRTAAYYRDRARGGAALLGLGSPLAQRHTKGWLKHECTLLEPRCVPAFARLAEAVHDHGAKLAVELTAVGVNDHSRGWIDDWHRSSRRRCARRTRTHTPSAGWAASAASASIGC